MILLAAMALAVASVPLLGGRFASVRGIRLRWLGCIPIALVFQLAVLELAPAAFSHDAVARLHLLSYVPAVVFLWANRAIPGLPMLGLGGICNLAAIAANGGVMPALPLSQVLAGATTPAGEFANSAAIAGARLWFLGDIFAWPHPLPLANVFSLGDLLLLVGAAAVLHTAAGSRIALRPLRVRSGR